MMRWRGDPELPAALRAMATALCLGAAIAALLLAPKLPARADEALDNASGARAAWRAALPRTPIDAVQPVVGIPGLVEIQSGARVFYGDALGKVLLIGNLYDVRGNRDLTQERAEILTARARLPWDALPLAGAIAVGRGGAEVAVFMDPHCGWCRKLYPEVASATSLRAHLVLLPLSEGSLETARSILCAKDPAAALEGVYAGKNLKPATCQDADDAIEAARSLARAHAINATPAMVAPDGRIRLGYQSVGATLAWIASDKPDSSVTEAPIP